MSAGPLFFRPLRVRASALVLVVAATAACRAGVESSSEPAAAGGDRVTIGDVHWYVDYEAAVEVARAQDKALWMHFGENPG